MVHDGTVYYMYLISNINLQRHVLQLHDLFHTKSSYDDLWPYQTDLRRLRLGYSELDYIKLVA